jgi:hypothetical protein
MANRHLLDRVPVCHDKRKELALYERGGLLHSYIEELLDRWRYSAYKVLAFGCPRQIRSSAQLQHLFEKKMWSRPVARVRLDIDSSVLVAARNPDPSEYA